MANISCPAPFIDPGLFQGERGYIKGRLCSYDARLGHHCCLPCPMTDWVYPDSFNHLSKISGWLSVVGAACCVFLCLSWAVLPAKATSRHYLSICVTVAVFLMTLGFVIPLTARPGRCHDLITPNDMHTNGACALSGTLLHFGGCAGVMWLLLRALTLHLQICWGRADSACMKVAALAAGWGFPLLLTTLSLVLSGVSVRFGDACYINHDYSMALTWIPMLVLSGLAVALSFGTLGYCIKVYVSTVLHQDTLPGSYTGGGGGGGTRRTSMSTAATVAGPREVYRRTMDAVRVQWRGIAVVLIIMADVIFFSCVFVFQDSVVRSVTHSPRVAEDWGLCLVAEKGEKERCLGMVSQHVVSYQVIIAVTVLLSFNGVWLLLFLGRWSMVMAWRDLFMEIVSKWRRGSSHSSLESSSPQGFFAYLPRGSRESSAASCQMSPIGANSVKTIGPLEERMEYRRERRDDV